MRQQFSIYTMSIMVNRLCKMAESSYIKDSINIIGAKCHGIVSGKTKKSIQGPFMRDTCAGAQNTPQQLVVLKYPNEFQRPKI